MILSLYVHGIAQTRKKHHQVLVFIVFLYQFYILNLHFFLFKVI